MFFGTYDARLEGIEAVLQPTTRVEKAIMVS